MRNSTAEQQTFLLKRVTHVASGSTDVVLDIEAYPAVTLGAMPGWLTGEPLHEQGVETEMPNLPREIVVPPVTPWSWRLLISGRDEVTLRLLLAPRQDPVFDQDERTLGIVTSTTTCPLTFREDDDRVEVSSGTAQVVITRNPFTLTVLDGEDRVVLRTSDRLRQVAGLPMAPGVVSTGGDVHLNLELAADESIYGFGEQFGRVEKNSQSFVLHCDDALGTGTGLAYKPVPVWHSSTGYAALLNTGADVRVDVGHHRPSVLSLGVAGDVLDLFLFVSPQPAARLGAYTDLTGRSHVPPLWAFGYWMGRCRYHSREEMLAVSAEMSERGIPCDVLHLDPDWLVVDRLNTDFIWNEERFGNRADFVAELADQGRRLSLWELPYLDPASPRYAELEAAGYLVTDTNGATAHLEGTPTPDGRPRALLDFANPAARRWWQEQHRSFLEDGVAVFKTDFGEGFPSRGVAASDVPRRHHHNLYPLWYNAAVSEAIGELTGRTPLVWGRSGWAGSHRYPGQWGGDAESTVAGMQATVRGGLSYALSAPGFWSHDIGGFFGPELTPGLYVRWTQLGALSPLMRAHGLRPREPWHFGEEAFEVARTWIRRRYQLLPYLWQAAHQSVAAGLPMMRPLYLEFPDDPVARTIDSQFLLGADLLVAPVFDDGMEPVQRRFYIPPGRWRDLYTGATYDGESFHTRTIPLSQMPVLVRDGATVPTLEVPAQARSTDDLLDAPWTLRTFGRSGTGPLVTFDGQTIPAAQCTIRPITDPTEDSSDE
ncbi:TIM-barrel domain-containing protein [Ruania albidiflava]|uniref:glycoside hydrolase family 31 protein n=1 Tax=Ruania albidiflava TaxID=366586 RepID=UPI0003B4BD11|nr:TIM-barrel domain-containing protein [Ruania albidiflava]